MTTAQGRTDTAVPPMVRGRFSWPVTSLLVLAAIPVVSMIVEIIRAPRMNYLDYWTVLGLASYPTGGYHLAGLFVVYNQHPVVTAGTIFWLDAKLFAGSNQVLGMLVVVLSLLVLAAMASMVPRRLSPTVQAAAIAGFALLLFSPGDLENFAEGMSGTHWLSGLAPAIVAIALAHRGRTLPALVLALVACFGHGSAFPVWIALAVIAWLRGDRRWKVITPVAVGVLVAVGVVIAGSTLPGAGSASLPAVALSLDRLFAVTSGVVGQLWSAQVADIAMLAGVVTLIGLVLGIALTVSARIRHDEQAPQAAGWAGFAVHIIATSAMIGVSRYASADNVGESGRYAIISALATCALLALAVILWRRAVMVTVLAVTVGLVTFTVGSGQATNVGNQYPNQSVLAVAARVGAVNTMTSLRMTPTVLPVIKALGVYPFTDDFTLGCGHKLGNHLDVAGTPQLAAGGDGTGGNVETGPVTGDTVITGWAVVNGRRPDCVLVVDDQGAIVGGGYVGQPRPDVATVLHSKDANTGWRAVAAPNANKPQVVVLLGGRIYRLTSAPKS